MVFEQKLLGSEGVSHVDMKGKSKQMPGMFEELLEDQRNTMRREGVKVSWVRMQMLPEISTSTQEDKIRRFNPPFHYI